MSDPQHDAARTADFLWQIQAVNFSPDEPFTLTSGRKSPVYVDCRRIISFPEARTAITDMAVALIEREIGRDRLDAVAGGETAGIPFAAWIADRLGLPMLYVRKKPKGFGRMAQIEGDMPEGCRVLLVEDLATDAGSKLAFIEALRAAGARVTDCFVVFHYGIFPASTEALKAIGVRLHGLTTWRDVVASARRGGYFDEAALTEVEAFLDDPEGWQKAREGAG
jgi:orotate phosphoribosyltransferase